MTPSTTTVPVPVAGRRAPHLPARRRAARAARAAATGPLACRVLHLHRVLLRTADDGRCVLFCSRCDRDVREWRPAVPVPASSIDAAGIGAAGGDVVSAWFAGFAGHRP